MIFVTVGTHEQQFDRLIKYIDTLKENKKIKDEVFIQIGFSKYIPKYCKYASLISYDDMNKYMSEADVIITHGGPASFMKAIQMGNLPIVVPRLKEYEEHVNNHQLDFCKAVLDKGYKFFLVENVESINDILLNNSFKSDTHISNNENFNRIFKQEVEGLF